MIRILLADDYTIIRKGVRQILTQAYPNAEIEEMEDGEEWTEKLKDTYWNMIIADLPMPDRGGLDTLFRLRQNFPSLIVLILTLYPQKNYALRALKAGAAGFLGRDAVPDELILAVRQVLSGKRYITIPWTDN